MTLCADPVPLLRHEASGVDVQVQSDGVMLKGKPRASKGGASAQPPSDGEGVLGLNSGFMYVAHTTCSGAVCGAASRVG